MLTSFWTMAAGLVFYIVISKKEPNASKMFEILSRKEDIGFHSMENTSILRQRLGTSLNQI